jgi:hypothetical protein
VFSVPQRKRRRRRVDGPVHGQAAQVEIHHHADGEHRALDQHQAHGAPPHQAALAEAKLGRWRTSSINAGAASLLRCRAPCEAPSWPIAPVGVPLGSAAGPEPADQRDRDRHAPHTTAHGVNTEPMNSTVVATAPERPDAGRRKERCALGPRVEALVTSTSRASAAKARHMAGCPGCTTADRARGPREAQSKLCGGGGLAVLHSSVPAPRDRPVRSPCRVAARHVDEKHSTLTAMTKAPMVAVAFHAVPAHGRAGRSTHGAACHAGPAGASGRTSR